MMRVKDFSDHFWSQHKSFFEKHDFLRSSRSIYTKKTNDIYHEISHEPILKPEGIYATLSFGIIYQKFQRIDRLTAKRKIQFGKPLYEFAGREFGFRLFKSLKDIEKSKKQVQGEVKKYGFPYFSIFRSSDDIFNLLKDPVEASKYFMISDDTSIEISIFKYLKEGANPALEYIGNALVCAEHSYQTKCSLQKIKKYIESKD